MEISFNLFLGRAYVAGGFDGLRPIGYDRWLMIDPFDRSGPELAAATKAWRHSFPDLRQIDAEGDRLSHAGWARAA
jgi:hypothetical protein